MRKTLSIVLSVVMILSACCFALPVSAAPEGTPINTADEFMAMAADGTYYLNADITLTASYANPFSGTLDGNGKTVTISAPMFAEFNGTAKNLTINGAITSDGDAGALAVTSTAGMIVSDVTNNVSITVTGEGKHAGGIFATNYGVDIISEYTNCVNNGDIYVAVYPLDTPLLAIGSCGLYEYEPEYPQGRAPELWFNLFNNMWGTNFPQWIEGDFTYRFTIRSAAPDAALKLSGPEAPAFIAGIPDTLELVTVQDDGQTRYLWLRDHSGKAGTATVRMPGATLMPTDLWRRPTGAAQTDELTFTVRPNGLCCLAISEKE